MSGIRAINEYIWEASVDLKPEIPLNVYLVRGERFAVWVDSGTKKMFPQLQATMEEAEVSPSYLRFVLHTHPHAHHIGCDGQMARYTGCLIAAQSRYAHWHTDFERHYQEYARAFPDLIPDTEALREKVLAALDEEHPVDLHINETVQFDLGRVFLSGYRFSGHMQSELAWFERHTRTFIFGDVLTMGHAPIIHGHVDVGGYRRTLERIDELLDELDVERVIFSHFKPKTPAETRELLEENAAFLDRLDTIVLNLIKGHGEIDLATLWEKVTDILGRRRDFRSLNAVDAHVRQYIEEGLVREIEPRVFTALE
jgi:glyoxylase-like metal-dependent hydrolase (beta-lactamase superfamily II)